VDDSHMFVREDQLKEELCNVIDLIQYVFTVMGFKDFTTQLSFRDDNEEKYGGDKKLWERAQREIKEAADEMKLNYHIEEGEAAFYGPKIDVQIWSAIGREFTLATNQVDFAVPERFDLKFTNKEGHDEVPLCIHRAPLSSHERMVGFLIEHYAGNFPVWIAPEQVRVISITDAQNEYTENLAKQLRESGIRAHADLSAQRMNAKIRQAQLMKVPYMLVVGENEMKVGQVSLRARDGSQQNNIPLDEFVARAKDKITRRVNEL